MIYFVCLPNGRQSGKLAETNKNPDRSRTGNPGAPHGVKNALFILSTGFHPTHSDAGSEIGGLPLSA
jgi:hypothetical protein